MNARLRSLRYQLVFPPARYSFEDTTPWNGVIGDFQANLAGRYLELAPLVAYDSVEDARGAVEPLLESWALGMELDRGLQVEFKRAGAEVEETDPSGDMVRKRLESTVHLNATFDPALAPGEYPSPPNVLLAHSEVVDDLLLWLREARRGHRLLVAAYLTVSRLAVECGGPREAARTYGISSNILGKLASLSVRRDRQQGRKFINGATPLTEEEAEWIRAVLPAVTRQVAEIAAGGEPSALTLANLPQIPKANKQTPLMVEVPKPND